MKKHLACLFIIAILSPLGCSESAPMPMGGTTESTAPTSTASGTTASGITASGTTASATTGSDAGETVRKADVGASGKGNYNVSSENPMSIVAVPVATYFKAGEMTVFRIQIPEALKLYNAENGSYPATQEEFMEKIIKANQIRLPELPAGDSYTYDPADHTLKIKTAKK